MKFEYIMRRFDKQCGNIENRLNALGNDGWELVSTHGDMFYFKRLIECLDEDGFLEPRGIVARAAFYKSEDAAGGSLP